jgi:aspartyl-tRNA(Asn)/glutamyl-tRNA(Gln) amidotransferase subunit C
VLARATAILTARETNEHMTDDTHPKPTTEATALVDQIAALARLDVRPDEAAALARQFTSILKQFEGLARLDLTGVEPLVSLSGAESVLRADEPEPSFSAERMLANAPERVDDFYRVPKTVGGVE